MSKKKLQEKKKKARERRAKAKVLKARAKKRAEAKHEREVAKIDRKYSEKPQPYLKPETRLRINQEQAEADRQKDEEIKKQLEHNVKILKALEEEYLAEQEARKQANESLEAEGHETLQEKLDVLAKRAEKEQKEKENDN